MKQWSPLLATSKAQQLLFRIVDVLLLPHALFQQDKNLPAAMLSAVRDSLPLYLQVGFAPMLCTGPAHITTPPTVAILHPISHRASPRQLVHPRHRGPT